MALIVSDPLDTWARVFVRSGGTCGLMTVDAAFCWGENTLGQIGDGTRRTRSIPTPVVGGLTLTSLAMGKEHTCGLTPAGEAYCWGGNQAGPLGDSTRANRPVPTAVSGGLTFVTLTAGKAHTCGTTATGAAYCWGENEYGQLGDGTRVDRLIPTAGAADTLTFTSLAAGNGHTCGLTADGEAYCWGDNRSGRRGDSTRTSPLNPTLVAGPYLWTRVGRAGVLLGAERSGSAR